MDTCKIKAKLCFCSRLPSGLFGNACLGAATHSKEQGRCREALFSGCHTFQELKRLWEPGPVPGSMETSFTAEFKLCISMKFPLLPCLRSLAEVQSLPPTSWCAWIGIYWGQVDDSRLTPRKHLGALPPGTQEAEVWLCIPQLLLIQCILQELLALSLKAWLSG